MAAGNQRYNKEPDTQSAKCQDTPQIKAPSLQLNNKKADSWILPLFTLMESYSPQTESSNYLSLSLCYCIRNIIDRADFTGQESYEHRGSNSF